MFQRIFAILCLLVSIAFLSVACSDGGSSGSPADDSSATDGDIDAPDGGDNIITNPDGDDERDTQTDSDDPIDTEDGDMEADEEFESGEEEIEEANPYSYTKKVAVYYGDDVEADWDFGLLYSVFTGNLLAHFNVQTDILLVDDYQSGDLAQYDAAIYLGTLYDYPIPSAFYDDVFAMEDLPFYWLGYGILRFRELPYNLDERFGFTFEKYVEDEGYDTLYYKDHELPHAEEDIYFIAVEPVEGAGCETLAYMENETKKRPFLLKCDKFFYMADNPFAYGMNDYLAFADSLHDLLRTDVMESHRALVRLEDIMVGSAELERLRAIADGMAERNIPFSIGLTPVYKDPEGVFGEPGSEMRMDDNPAFVETIDYLRSKGGRIVVHGYSHQYDGLSGDDFEFWEENANTPVPEDSWEWATGRIDAAKAEFQRVFGQVPQIWETPHYQASYLDYFAIGSRFDFIFERHRAFDTLVQLDEHSTDIPENLTIKEQRAPYMLFDTSFGFSIIPENLGYIHEGHDDPFGVPENPGGKAQNARDHLAVRDGVVAFFFHHWQPLDMLWGSIENLQELGYTFVDSYSLLDEKPPYYRDKDPNYVEEDGDIDDDVDELPDGDIEPDVEEDDVPEAIVCPHGAQQCPWGMGCIMGFCGQCETAEHCRAWDGCRDDKTCGECSAHRHCREGESCRHGFCTPDELAVAEVSMNPDDFTAMIENQWDETDYPCVATIDGITYDIGETISLFGVSSRKYPKKAIRIEFPEDSQNPGYSRKINLKADWNDPAYMRSMISFETFRRLSNIPTPRVRYRKLYINGEYYGLMVDIERIGGKFLTVNGRDRDESLYEADEAYVSGALVPMPDLESYMHFYNKKSGNEDDYSDVISFIEQDLWSDFEANREAGVTVMHNLREKVHMESYINYLATLVLVQNIDSVENNFHFSWQQDNQGRSAWEFYPWDMDISLGCTFDPVAGNALCTDLTYNQWYLSGYIMDDEMPLFPNNVWCNMAMHLTFHDETYRPRFEERICEFMETDFWQRRLPLFAEALYETIYDDVEADPNKMLEEIEEFTNAKNKIKEFFELREEHLMGELWCNER